MMKIARSRIDKRGRITLPRSFLKANNLDKSTHVYFLPMQGSSSSIKLVFEWDGEPTTADEYNKEVDGNEYAEDIDNQAFAQGRESSYHNAGKSTSEPVDMEDAV